MDETKPYDHPDNKGKLTEYEAFQLDAGLAYRYSGLEREEFSRHMHDLRQAIKLTGRFHRGGKHLRYEKFKSDIGDTHDEDEADDDALITYGKGSVIE